MLLIFSLCFQWMSLVNGDNDTWAGFQSADASSMKENIGPAKLVDTKTQSTSDIGDLFKDSPPITSTSMSATPEKDAKCDIMSLFDKPNMASPFSVHQQLSLLVQQQSLLMAAAVSGSGGMPKVPGNALQRPNGTTSSNQSWPNVGYQFPGMVMPVTGKILVFYSLDRLGTWEQLIQLGALLLCQSLAHIPRDLTFQTMAIRPPEQANRRHLQFPPLLRNREMIMIFLL